MRHPGSGTCFKSQTATPEGQPESQLCSMVMNSFTQLCGMSDLESLKKYNVKKDISDIWESFICINCPFAMQQYQVKYCFGENGGGRGG